MEGNYCIWHNCTLIKTEYSGRNQRSLKSKGGLQVVTLTAPLPWIRH